MQHILAADPPTSEAATTGSRSVAVPSARQQRYRQASAFMDWFAPAWDYLNPTEQLVLLSCRIRLA